MSDENRSHGPPDGHDGQHGGEGLDSLVDAPWVSFFPTNDGSGQMSSVLARMVDLCHTVTEELGAAGAVVGLMSLASSAATRVLAASDDAAARTAELEFSLGEGPSVEAFTSARPVLVPDLAEPFLRGRWPLFSEHMESISLGAVFAFPLQLGASRFGVMSIYAAHPMRLVGDSVRSVMLHADLATSLLLEALDARSTEGTSQLGLEERLDQVTSAFEVRSEVFQAQGMVMVDLGVSLAEALVLMRAHAFAEGESLPEIANAVVGRRLSLRDAGVAGGGT